MSEVDFYKNVIDHVMSVHRADGVSRHLSFQRPSSGTYKFHIITEPGILIIWGDCGAFTFERLTDMFEFFRMDRDDFNHSEKRNLQINPGYWSEKVTDGNDRCRVYSPSQTEASIRQFLKDSECENIEDVMHEIVLHDGEYDAGRSIMECEELGYNAVDCIQREYECHFMWCIRAIVWGINEFDRREKEALDE